MTELRQNTSSLVPGHGALLRAPELTLALFLVFLHFNPTLSASFLPSLLLALTLPLLNVICGLVKL